MRSLEENKIVEIKDEITVRQENQMSKVYSVLLINIAHWMTNFQTTFWPFLFLPTIHYEES
jgi:hypothetical protein